MAHRSVQREDRRRRVLREETRSGGAPRKRRAAHGDRLFSEAALQRNQPRITDLLPQRKMAVFKVFAVGLGLVASVESLYALREQYLSKYPQIDTRWLDLDGGQTLASCVAAVMLAAATMVASIVFHIRRYRMDDYRGRYRIWYPVIVLLALGAADVVTHAHNSLFGVAMSLWPQLPIQAPAACWMLAWLVSGGLLLVRAAIDARQCKTALCVWLLSASGLLFAAALKLDVLQLPSHHFTMMAGTGSFLLGLHFLVFGLLLYARHLFLSAQGARRLAASRKPTDEEDAEPSEEPAATPEKTQAPRTGMIRLPGFGRWRRAATGAAASASAADDEQFTQEELALLENTDLTRTERRKLKKQMKLRRRQAA